VSWLHRDLIAKSAAAKPPKALGRVQSVCAGAWPAKRAGAAAAHLVDHRELELGLSGKPTAVVLALGAADKLTDTENSLDG
jgi:hypothetical protein